MALLNVSSIYKTYEESPFLKDISFSLEEGQILCLLGPSGCGKSTLLRIIAGLETSERGKVQFDGNDISGVPPHQRKFGMMFQEFALFPHRNVFDNVAFGLQIQKLPQEKIKNKVMEALTLVGLSEMTDRRIDELSGGERQRVALARSLAPQPRLLMLDEPMGSLDRMLRERLILDLRKILKEIGVTAIFVTHDHTEAFDVADLVAVFDQGKIAQIAPPEALYQSPASMGVARFLGFENFIHGIILEGRKVETELGIFSLDQIDREIGDHVTLLIRPEACRILESRGSSRPGETPIKGVIVDRRFQGAYIRISFKAVSGSQLIFTLPSNIDLKGLEGPRQIALNTSAIVCMSD